MQKPRGHVDQYLLILSESRIGYSGSLQLVASKVVYLMDRVVVSFLLISLLPVVRNSHLSAHVNWCAGGKIKCPAEVSGLAIDQCLDKHLPCGTFCHSYWLIDKAYCKETGKCVEFASEENLRCRNQEHGCKTGEHYCESAGEQDVFLKCH